MAKIIISRAGGKKEYEVTNDQAHKISAAVDTAKRSGVAKLIKFEHLEFMSTDYKGAEFDADRKLDDAMTMKAKEWHEGRRIFAKKTAQDKTDRFMANGFKVFSSVVTNLGIDQRDEIRERVLEFFKNNPRRCYPDGYVFKGDYGVGRITMWDQGKLNLLEKAINEDMLSVQKDEEYEKKMVGIQTVEQDELGGISDKELAPLF